MYKILADGALLCTSQDEKTLVQNPVVTLEANKAGSFTFTLNPGHDFYGLIAKHDTVLTVERDNEIIFQGVAVKETKDFMGNLTYTCEGELTYLNDSIQRPCKYTNQTVRSLLEAYIAAHNAQVEAKKQFTVGDVDVTAGNTILRYTNYETTMKELQEDFIDNFGGYFSIRYEHGVKYLDYHATSQRTNTQVIELGKNLLTYSSNLDLTQVCTVLIPLGCRLDTQEVEGLDARLTIKSVNNNLDYLEGANVATYGRITKVMTWDDVTVPSILKSKGQKYLEDEQFDNVVIQASAVDLSYVDTSVERFCLLDSVKIKSPIHGMDRYFLLSKQTINLNEPGKDVFTFGETQKATMTAKNAAATSSLQAQINQLPVDWTNAITHATDLISGADGGYVVIGKNANDEPERILIMDNNDMSQAQNVIQLNKNGIGFSTTGVNGPYTNAWTIDGNLIADFIHGGTFTAGGYNNQNGLILVKTSSNTDAAKIDNQGLKMQQHSTEAGHVGEVAGILVFGENGLEVWDAWGTKPTGVAADNPYLRMTDGTVSLDSGLGWLGISAGHKGRNNNIIYHENMMQVGQQPVAASSGYAYETDPQLGLNKVIAILFSNVDTFGEDGNEGPEISRTNRSNASGKLGLRITKLGEINKNAASTYGFALQDGKVYIEDARISTGNGSGTYYTLADFINTIRNTALTNGVNKVKATTVEGTNVSASSVSSTNVAATTATNTTTKTNKVTAKDQYSTVELEKVQGINVNAASTYGFALQNGSVYLENVYIGNSTGTYWTLADYIRGVMNGTFY